ncbi:MAG: hypothetical protein QM813_10930 [Verrucomicrobiota bacterium]
MRLSEHKLGIEWLRQFDARDIHIARLLLDGLKLVSFGESEAALAKAAEQIISATTGLIAVFPIDKRIIFPSGTPNSADRLRHAMTNLDRVYPERLLIEPSHQDMIDKRVRHILLLEDFVGSGQRVNEFWDLWMLSPTIRSWHSYHRIELWIAGYAIHDVGLEAMHEHITFLRPDHVRFDLRLSAQTNYWPEAVVELCERNAKRTELPIYPMGMGHLGVPLVFQHGCPDNCPTILWKHGKTFEALFPGRGIPPDLHQCFSSATDCGRTSQLLWDAERHRGALSLIREMEGRKRSPQYVELIAVLSLLHRGYAAANLNKVMTLKTSHIHSLLTTGQEMGLVNGENLLTDFGRDIVQRSKKSFLPPTANRDASIERGIGYIPMQFKKSICGVQRTSSNALPTVE